MVNLGLYSRQILTKVREQTHIDYDCLTKGIMHFYTDKKEFEQAHAPTERMRQLGCDREIISVKQAILLEPALASCADNLVGATYTALDESGDAKKIYPRACQTLAKIKAFNFCLIIRLNNFYLKINKLQG